MFIVNHSQYLDIKKDVSYPSRKYGRSIFRQSKPFIWSEDLDYFLEVCQNAINSFIDDCKEDIFEDLDEINLGYLYQLNFPNANILAKKYPIEFCRLVSSDNDPESSGHSLLIYEPYFDFKSIEITQETFLINPITNIYIKDNQIVMEGFGYFIKDRDGYYYSSVNDFINKENLIKYR